MSKLLLVIMLLALMIPINHAPHFFMGFGKMGKMSLEYSEYQLFICILCQQLTWSVLLLTRECEDGAWTANVNMPLDGTSISGANVGIKRDVTF